MPLDRPMMQLQMYVYYVVYPPRNESNSKNRFKKMLSGGSSAATGVVYGTLYVHRYSTYVP